jgi:glycosyltransferase involved in cell wall biosynthesis
VPGSGIDTQRFLPCALPDQDGHSPVFLLLGRILRDKGVVEYVEAARMLKARCPGARLALLGFLDVENVSAISRAQMDAWVAEGVIEYWGETHDVRPMIARADCVVLPSYREGMPRTLLEAAAMARPLVASDVPGCREVVEHGVNGMLCQVKSASALAQAMANIAELSPADREVLGAAGRRKVEQTFSLNKVIECYQHAIAVSVAR